MRPRDARGRFVARVVRAVTRPRDARGRFVARVARGAVRPRDARGRFVAAPRGQLDYTGDPALWIDAIGALPSLPAPRPSRVALEATLECVDEDGESIETVMVRETLVLARGDDLVTALRAALRPKLCESPAVTILPALSARELP